MRLVGVQIEGFRSIADVADITLRRELTCLIGANEHGKSNILRAINLLDEGQFEEFDKYEGSRSAAHPRVTFELLLSRPDAKGLTQAIREELQNLPDDDQPGTSKTRRLFSDAIDRLTHGDLDRCQLRLEADDSRHLIAGGVIFRFGSASLPESRKRRIQLWFEQQVPRVQLFEATDELVDSISLHELRGGLTD